jgi:hypothetical protein
MSKSRSSNRTHSNIRKHSNVRKHSKSMRKQNRHSRSVSNKHRRSMSKQRNSAVLTRRNWMKKLLFKGGDASHHAENVFGGIGQHHAMSENNNAIHQNPPMAQGGAQLEMAM